MSSRSIKSQLCKSILCSNPYHGNVLILLVCFYYIFRLNLLKSVLVILAKVISLCCYYSCIFIWIFCIPIFLVHQLILLLIEVCNVTCLTKICICIIYAFASGSDYMPLTFLLLYLVYLQLAFFFYLILEYILYFFNFFFWRFFILWTSAFAFL